jgi:hypothetical protein
LSSAPAADGTFPTIFCESFLRCPSPYPGGPTGCVCLVLPQRRRPSQTVKSVGFPLLSVNTTFHGYHFGAAAISFMFRPPSLLASQIVPTAASFPAGQLRRFHPSRTRVVTFARIGYASHPTTGNWRHEDFHLARFTALSAAPYGPVLLLMPFRFQFAMDTLPSEVQQAAALGRSWPYPAFAFVPV